MNRDWMSAQSHDQLNAIIDNAYDGILIADELGYVVRVNPAFCRLSGLPESAYVGKHLTELVKTGIFREPSVTWQALQERRPVTGIQRYPTGQEHLVSAVPIVSGEGDVKGVVANIRDMTELSRLREQLEATQEKSRQYESELQDLRKRLAQDEIVAVSPAMTKVMELAGRVANFDSTVLILGESGVGKEVVARYIHRVGNRSDGPFVEINCGALPEDLLESELFGYEPGAFTGARRTGKTGLFEAADGGILFLDEIGEMSPALQVKLLRVIQDQEFTRVGGVETVRVNCRIIAATHRDLKERVRRGLFREDLFYRLYVVPIYIPPLRERPEDIPALVQYYLKKCNEKYGTFKQIHPSVVQILQSQRWPGNVRQLANVVERLVVTVPEDVIEERHLPQDYLDGPERLGQSQSGEFTERRSSDFDMMSPTFLSPGERGRVGEKNAFVEMERELILRALSRYGSARKAGRALGVSHTTIIKKMKKYGIERRKVGSG